MAEADKTKGTDLLDGETKINYIQVLLSVFLLLTILGSIFSYVPFQNEVDLVEEYKTLYPKIKDSTNQKELSLFKEFKSQLPKEYVTRLKKIKQHDFKSVQAYKKRKEQLVKEQNVFGFIHLEAFLQYIGMYLSLIALSIAGFIGARIKDNSAKKIFDIIYFLGILIGIFFVYYAVYDEADFPRAVHYFVFISYIIISFLILRSVHYYLINFKFYSSVIKKLNSLLLTHSLKYIHPNKKEKYIHDTVEEIDKTIYRK